MVYAAVYEGAAEGAGTIEHMLSKLYHHEIHVYSCESIFDLENYVLDMRSGNVDILFVSLSQAAEQIISRVGDMQRECPHLQVTFLAEEDSQAIQIFRANPAYAIKKPVDCGQLQEAMNRMLVRLRRVKKEVLVFDAAGGTLIIPQEEILYVESDRKEVVFHLTQQRRERAVGKLDIIEPLLGESFVRCHQSYIVNAAKIGRFTRREVYLFNLKKIPISRPRSTKTREAILGYLRTEKKTDEEHENTAEFVGMRKGQKFDN